MGLPDKDNNHNLIQLNLVIIRPRRVGNLNQFTLIVIRFAIWLGFFGLVPPEIPCGQTARFIIACIYFGSMEWLIFKKILSQIE